MIGSPKVEISGKSYAVQIDAINPILEKMSKGRSSILRSEDKLKAIGMATWIKMEKTMVYVSDLNIMAESRRHPLIRKRNTSTISLEIF